MKYMRDNINDEYGIIEYQDKLLEIMVYLDQFCNENNIDYCLMAGSALGAERHQGFIPWDDDIDIYMMEKDYLRFRELFKKNGDSDNYYLQEWGATDWRSQHMITMAKLRKNGSVIEEKTYEGWKMHQGIFIDIFVLHNCPSSRIKQIVQYMWTEAVVLKWLEISGYKPKNIKDQIMLFGSKILPTKWILRQGLCHTYKYQNKNTELVQGFIDTRGFSRAVFPKDALFPAKYSDFEKVRLKVPAKNHEYLTIQFGKDYMTPPPVEERPINKHTHGWIDSGDIVYTEFSDEVRLI